MSSWAPTFPTACRTLAEALFAEVHRSNMSKLDANGQVIYRADGKVLKSARWSPPNLEAVLARATVTE